MTLRVAVVGSGPAGFYAAGHLLDADLPVEVDMLERLPTPWGLVRLGVAPDHPKIKAVSKAFERIAARARLPVPRRRRGRPRPDARRSRRAVRRRRLRGRRADRPADGHPGRGSPRLLGGHRVRRLVQRPPELPGARVRPLRRAGGRRRAGNVALDVVRMLALAPEEIRPTDTTDEAIEAILGSGLEEIVLLARRGPAQAAFTTPELKELGELADADVLVDPAELELDPASEASLAHDTNARRNVEVLREYAQRPAAGKRRAIRLRFCVSPVAILGDGSGRGDRDRPQPARRRRLGRVSAEPTDERETIPCGIVFRSVGYLGVELPGVPFDARRATIPNEDGRVAGRVPAAYCAGWIKRGPSGVIGTNKKDATETVDLLLEDARAGLLQRGDPAATAETVEQLLVDRGVAYVTYTGWEAIDADERGRGEPHGRPRVKLVTWNELLDAARSKSGRRRRGSTSTRRPRLADCAAAAYPSNGGHANRAAAPIHVAWRSVSGRSSASTAGTGRSVREAEPRRGARVPALPVRRLGIERRAVRAHPRLLREPARAAASPARSVKLDSVAVARTEERQRALGRRDRQGDRELPRLRRADPGARRALARPDQGGGRPRERRAGPARRGEGGADRGRRRPHRRRRARRPVPDRRLPDRLGHVVEHERQRGDGRRSRARTSTPTTT